jgi:hypothetical protein
MKAASKKVST